MSTILTLTEKGKPATGKARPAILQWDGLYLDVRLKHKGDHASCERYAADSTLLGRTWRLITLQELVARADYTRTAPAFDTTLFAKLPEYGWIWTGTPYAGESKPSSPVFAWGVDLSRGYANVLDRLGGGLALPVSPVAAPASQS